MVSVVYVDHMKWSILFNQIACRHFLELNNIYGWGSTTLMWFSSYFISFAQKKSPFSVYNPPGCANPGFYVSSSWQNVHFLSN